MAELDQEIKALVAKVIRKDASAIDPNVNIFTEYHVDSLLGVEILAALDKKYDLDIPEDKIRSIKTLNDIILLTKEHIKSK